MGKTLEEIEGVVWPDPEWNSHLVTTCHALRKKPIDDFTVEDLRIMIGQQISLSVLIPLALQTLDKNPLAQGDYYPGDLLHNVLSVIVPRKEELLEHLAPLSRIAQRGLTATDNLDLRKEIEGFLKQHAGASY